MPAITHRAVSGRYRGRRGQFEAELRIDVDGERSMKRVSADFFEWRAGVRNYTGSMCVDAPEVHCSATLMTITGVSRRSWERATRSITITIALTPDGTQRPPATLVHSTTRGTVPARVECAFESASFRTTRIEEAVEEGVRRFESYDTGALDAGCPPRTMSHLTAFADAGIEMVRTRDPADIAIAANDSWSDAELQAAMVHNFSLFEDAEQWAIWLLHARLHDRDRNVDPPRLYGLMFDQRGRQRQGCALFYGAMAGSTPERQRLQLFTCVHELGHGFNLLHSFQKSLAVPPVPSRPGSATWMAYPNRFPGGAREFWRAFAFRFDDPELVHLRHAMREDAIMGGNPFEAGAAFEQDAATRDVDPGLRLELSVEPVLPLGVPVTVDMRLWGTTREGRNAPRVLGPRPGSVDIAIRTPDGTASVFEPFLRHCRVDDAKLLRAGDQPIESSAFIHFGKDGFAFDRPGRYDIRARCATPDGSSVISNVVRIVVRPPVTRADRVATELVFGTQQGALMSLVGSDSPELRSGDDALRTVVERFPQHAVAAVPRLVRATNDAREFKLAQADGSVRVRAARPQQAAALLRTMPRLETALRTAVTRSDAASREPAVAAALKRVASPAAAHILDPYIRSRSHEILPVAAQVVSTGPVGRPPWDPGPRRGDDGGSSGV